MKEERRQLALQEDTVRDKSITEVEYPIINHHHSTDHVEACDTDGSSHNTVSGITNSGSCATSNLNSAATTGCSSATDTDSSTEVSSDTTSVPTSPGAEPCCRPESQSDCPESSEKSCDEKCQSNERHIINLAWVSSEILRTYDEHVKRKTFCSSKDWKCDSSRRQGLYTHFFYKCAMCGETADFWSEPRNKNCMGINQAAVSSTIITGIGFAQLEELFAAININCMSEPSYIKTRDEITLAFEKSATDSMEEAMEEERNLAFANGDYIMYNGRKIAVIAVVTDGQWGRRSYGHGYNALSGAVAIVGYRTNKVLYKGVKNKFCSRCDYYLKKGAQPPQHHCFKNFDANVSSSKMESDAIVEGFQDSLKHDLIYKTFVADNDSSVWKAILDANPYDDQNIVVEKVECSNHLLRNCCKKVESIAKITQGKKKRTPGFVDLRNKVVGSSCAIRNEIIKAVDRRIELGNISDSETAVELKKDILNIHHHMFGDHSLCADRGLDCQNQENETNFVPKLQEFHFWEPLDNALDYLSNYSADLLRKMTNNFAEAFNSVINKYIGGKRVFFGGRNSYNCRVAAAVVQYNTQSVLCQLHKGCGYETPEVAEKIEARRRAKHANNRANRLNKNPDDRPRAKQIRRNAADKYYGTECEKPALSEAALESFRAALIERLAGYAKNWKFWEEQTVDQASSSSWHMLRRRMLTASHFGAICCMRKTTSPKARVNSVCHPKILKVDAVNFGKANEAAACKELQKAINRDIERCGLFIDQKSPFLGASPDGLVGDDCIVEIKCSFQAADMTIAQAMALKNSAVKAMFDKKDPTKMNEKHKHYYQVQGQLHITKRDFCYFVVWTGKEMKYVKVPRNDEFWEEKMEPKLISFYHEHIVPELAKSSQTSPSRRKRSFEPPKSATQETNQNGAKRRRESEGQKSATQTSNQNAQCQTISVTDSSENRDKRQSPKRKRPSEAPKSATQESNQNGAKRRRKSEGEKSATRTRNQDEQFPTENPEHRDYHAGYENEILVWGDDVTDAARLEYINNMQASLESVKHIVSNVHTKLNDACIDTFLKLLREKSEFKTQSVQLMLLRNLGNFVQEEKEKSIQIIGGDSTQHWRCVHFDGECLRLYDSLGECNMDSITDNEIEYLLMRFPHAEFIPQVVQSRQPDELSCGVYACAMATTIFFGGDPATANYSSDSTLMRQHLISIIEKQELTPFPGN